MATHNRSAAGITPIVQHHQLDDPLDELAESLGYLKERARNQRMDGMVEALDRAARLLCAGRILAVAKDLEGVDMLARKDVVAMRDTTTNAASARQWFGTALHRPNFGCGGIKSSDQQRVGPFNTKAEAYAAAHLRMVELDGFGMFVTWKEVHHD